MKALLTILLLLTPVSAFAKSHAFRTPSGRQIYDDSETIGDVLDQNQRQFVIEAAVGAGPEGNLGIVAGWLMPQVKGLELYAGVGVEAAPAVHLTLSLRYLMNFGGYRPYIGAGYLLNLLPELGTASQNVFGEVGYSWALAHTYHLTLGVGVRWLLGVSVVDDDSILSSQQVDPRFLDEQIDAIPTWVPTVALRFSRAF
ncbi:MAG: hypothetical protein RMA76_24700 [Deltaproteobacteria bacterium]